MTKPGLAVHTHEGGAQIARLVDRLGVDDSTARVAIRDLGPCVDRC